MANLQAVLTAASAPPSGGAPHLWAGAMQLLDTLLRTAAPRLPQAHMHSIGSTRTAPASPSSRSAAQAQQAAAAAPPMAAAEPSHCLWAAPQALGDQCPRCAPSLAPLAASMAQPQPPWLLALLFSMPPPLPVGRPHSLLGDRLPQPASQRKRCAREVTWSRLASPASPAACSPPHFLQGCPRCVRCCVLSPSADILQILPRAGARVCCRHEGGHDARQQPGQSVLPHQNHRWAPVKLLAERTAEVLNRAFQSLTTRHAGACAVPSGA